jgi:hypothetical protein
LSIWVGIILYKKYKNKIKIELQKSWKMTETDFQSVILNLSCNINWRNPYRIISQVEEQNKIYTFESENIWFNPEKHIEQNQKIIVFVDHNNTKRYRMDISFLPRIW